jgi:hypothetical protein
MFIKKQLPLDKNEPLAGIKKLSLNAFVGILGFIK